VISRAAFCFAATLTLALQVSACRSSEGDGASVDRSSGPLAEQSFQWSAGPSIDLATGSSVPIRAYIESGLDAQTMGDLRYAYPGFDQAVPTAGDGDSQDVLKNNLRPDDDRGPVNNPAVGNNLFFIQDIVQVEGTVTATLCNYRYRVALKNKNGSFSSVAGTFVNDDGIDAMRLLLTAPPQPGDSLPPQTGSAAAPADDVFGGWQISGFLTSWVSSHSEFAAAWPTYDADLAKCVAEAPDPPDRRAFLTNGEHPRSDFPTSPPNPGWPEPAK
jgi:hypothetical protein